MCLNYSARIYVMRSKTEYNQNQFVNEGKRDWEAEARFCIKESLQSKDHVERALAEELLKMDRLNEFCFVISPKIVKHLLRSEHPNLQGISYRLWSSNEEGHVCVLALDKKRKKIFLIEVAGQMSSGKEHDSPLGIHELDASGTYQLFGNENREQFISKEYTAEDQLSGDPETEEQMGSVKLKGLKQTLE